MKAAMSAGYSTVRRVDHPDGRIEWIAEAMGDAAKGSGEPVTDFDKWKGCKLARST